jgi:uncharacterized protein (DUF2461 family)
LKNILANKIFKSYFDGLESEKLKMTPKGFPKDHPDIDLLQFKSFMVMNEVSDKDVLSSDFHNHIINVAKALKPLNDFVNSAN